MALECLSPLVKSLDHWYQQQEPLEPGLGGAFAVFSVHCGPVFISPTSQWCKPHKPSESGHRLALVLLAGRPLFPCIARLMVIYTPDRCPSVPGSPGARPLQCPPPPWVRMVGQRPACKKGLHTGPHGLSLASG